MALQTGRPSDNAKGARRRRAGVYVNEIAELIDLHYTDPNEWAMLVKFDSEPQATNFVRSVIQGKRKMDFDAPNAFDAKFEPETFEVWVQCTDPEAAQKSLDERKERKAQREAQREAERTAGDESGDDSDDDDE